jgi:hypothetical protein
MKHLKKHITKKRKITKRRRLNRRRTVKKYDGGVNFKKLLAYFLLVSYGTDALKAANKIRETRSLPPRLPPPDVKHLIFDDNDDDSRRTTFSLPNTLEEAVTNERDAGKLLKRGVIDTALLTKSENNRYGDSLSNTLELLKEYANKTKDNPEFNAKIDEKLSNVNVDKLTEGIE